MEIAIALFIGFWICLATALALKQLKKDYSQVEHEEIGKK